LYLVIAPSAALLGDGRAFDRWQVIMKESGPSASLA
jgi:hypothetical protein